jgi:hypothetical protein
MRAIHYIVDCEGKVLRSPFRQLREVLGSADSEHSLITQAVEKLGYVHVQEWPQGLVILYGRTAMSPVTLAGAIFLLSDLAEKRIILSVVDRQVSFSLFRGRAQAIAMLAREMRVLEDASYRPDRSVPRVDTPRFQARGSAT